MIFEMSEGPVLSHEKEIRGEEHLIRTFLVSTFLRLSLPSFSRIGVSWVVPHLVLDLSHGLRKVVLPKLALLVNN